MSEPRVRPSRHQGQLNFGNEIVTWLLLVGVVWMAPSIAPASANYTKKTNIRQMLHAYGDPAPHKAYPQEPNAETVRVLDSMVTDFIIESCHAAGRTAAHAGRQKVKAEDFHFALREDPAKLGRVQELFKIERELKEARKAFNENDDRLAGLKEMEKQTLDEGKDVAESGTAGEKKAKTKGKGKGRPKGKGNAEKKADRRR